jgi:two-component system, cell cycle sensor histidine kinase and response regulator CckA
MTDLASMVPPSHTLPHKDPPGKNTENPEDRIVRLEETLARAEDECRMLRRELMRRNRMAIFGELIEGMAHDFRNILNVIVGFGSLASNTPDIDAAHRYAEKSLTAAKKGGVLAGEMLYLVRVDAGEWEETDLVGTIHSVVELSQYLLKKNGVALTLRGHTSMTCMAMPGAVKLAVLHLILNAARALAGSRAEIRRLNIILDKDEDFFIARFSDNGCGMDPVSAQPWARFLSGKTAESEIADHPGCGFRTIRRVMEAHGGRAAMDSREGYGTEVTLTFPLQPAREEGGDDTA